MPYKEAKLVKLSGRFPQERCAKWKCLLVPLKQRETAWLGGSRWHCPWAASGDGSGERAALSGARLLMFLQLRGALQANRLPPQGRNTAHTGAAEPLHFPKMRLSLGMSGSPTNQGNSKSLCLLGLHPQSRKERRLRELEVFITYGICASGATPLSPCISCGIFAMTG